MQGDPTSRSGYPAAHELDAALTERLRRATTAARELSDLLWEALHEELRARSDAGPQASRVAELSTRLADIASTISALGHAVSRETAGDDAASPSAVSSTAGELGTPVPVSSSPTPPVARGQSLSSDPPVAESTWTPGRSVVSDSLTRVERPFEHAHGSRPAVVIIDERDDPPVAEAPAGTPERPDTQRSRSQIQSPIRPRPLPWDTPLTDELRVTRSGERPSAHRP
ncbi:MAG TPA: hypothetical protein VGG98_07730 [Solirubrobacteraceae bacterium]|jgi:hypothetical protein